MLTQERDMESDSASYLERSTRDVAELSSVMLSVSQLNPRRVYGNASFHGMDSLMTVPILSSQSFLCSSYLFTGYDTMWHGELSHDVLNPCNFCGNIVLAV